MNFTVNAYSCCQLAYFPFDWGNPYSISFESGLVTVHFFGLWLCLGKTLSFIEENFTEHNFHGSPFFFSFCALNIWSYSPLVVRALQRSLLEVLWRLHCIFVSLLFSFLISKPSFDSVIHNVLQHSSLFIWFVWNSSSYINLDVLLLADSCKQSCCPFLPFLFQYNNAWCWMMLCSSLWVLYPSPNFFFSFASQTG